MALGLFNHAACGRKTTESAVKISARQHFRMLLRIDYPRDLPNVYCVITLKQSPIHITLSLPVSLPVTLPYPHNPFVIKPIRASVGVLSALGYYPTRSPLQRLVGPLLITPTSDC